MKQKQTKEIRLKHKKRTVKKMAIYSTFYDFFFKGFGKLKGHTAKYNK